MMCKAIVAGDGGGGGTDGDENDGGGVGDIAPMTYTPLKEMAGLPHAMKYLMSW